MAMQELPTLFVGLPEGEAQLFHTPEGIAVLLAGTLLTQLGQGEDCGCGVVRLGDAAPSGSEWDGFDQMILTPPYGRDSDHQWQESRSIRAGLERLRPGGSCICVVSNGWLARRTPEDVETRRMLVETYAVTRLILLPPQTFGTGGQVSAFFLEKRPPGEAGVLVTDLRGVGTGYNFLKALCRTGADGVRLMRAQLRTGDYMLLPEAYKKQAGGPETLEALEKALHSLYRQAEGGETPRQLSLFAPVAPPPARDTELVRRLIELEYRRLDCLFQALCRQRSWPRRPGRSLFALRNGVEHREEGQKGAHPLFTAAGFSGFARTATVTGQGPTLVIGRVGASCGQVYRVWERCTISVNAMYLTRVEEDLSLDLLLLLLREADLNRLKRGSAQCYITQDTVLDWDYPVPPPLEAREVCARFGPDLERIHRLEVELIAGNRP